MIGNDIVDLNDARLNSRWREQRFLDKLFTQEEQALILNNDGYQTLWRLWSMKESAYKIWARNLKTACFNPKFFKCDIVSESIGTVVFNEYIVNTTTSYNSDVIYTTGQLYETSKCSEIVKLESGSKIEKQRFLKEKTIEAYSNLMSVSKESISIEKNKFGVPQFLISDRLQPNFLTLTHHGNYGGFAISY